MFWRNLELLQDIGVPYYITFTDCSESEQGLFWKSFKSKFPTSYEFHKRDAFNIQLVQYDALK